MLRQLSSVQHNIPPVKSSLWWFYEDTIVSMHVSLGHSSETDHFPPSTWDDHRTKNCHFCPTIVRHFQRRNWYFWWTTFILCPRFFLAENHILTGSGCLEILIHFLSSHCTSFSEYELTGFDKQPLFCVHEFFCRWWEVEILTRLGYQESKGIVYILAYL